MRTTTRPAVYVASPLGFTEPGRRFLAEVLHPRLERAGLVVLDPWADPEGRFETLLGAPRSAERDLALRHLNDETGSRNALLIRECSIVFAVLDGAEPDSGVSSEVGYAAAHRKAVIGWRSDIRAGGDNDQAAVNLQVEHFVRASGGEIVSDLDEAIEALLEIV